MHKKFEHQFQGKIWNTAFGENVAVLEIRDENTRQVSFSAVDLQNGEILWQDLRPEKSWWLALVGVFDNYLILHKYSSQQKPEPKGILILNVQTGEIVQKIDDWIFFDYQDNLLTVYQLDGNNLPVYQELELTPPQPLPLMGGAFDVQKSPSHQGEGLGWGVVIHYPEDSPHFPTIFNFLYRLLGIEAQKGVDYLEIDNKIVISYYIYRNNLFQNYILVITHDRQILLNDLIATTEGIGIDTFTLQSDTLLYVKNENYFVGYEL